MLSPLSFCSLFIARCCAYGVYCPLTYALRSRTHTFHNSIISSPSKAYTNVFLLFFSLLFSLLFIPRHCGDDASPWCLGLLATVSRVPRHGVDLATLRIPCFSTVIRPMLSSLANARDTWRCDTPSSSLACWFVL